MTCRTCASLSRSLFLFLNLFTASHSFTYTYDTMIIQTGVGFTQYSTFGQGGEPPVLDFVDCTGTEARLIDCNSGTLSCSHTELAGVRCQTRTSEYNISHLYKRYRDGCIIILSIIQKWARFQYILGC